MLPIMPPFGSPSLSVFALLLAMSGCGRPEDQAQQALEPDPAIVAALAEPIMTDPDLAAQNRGNAAIVIGAFDGVPAWTRNPDEIAAARAAAVRLAGGTLQAAPTAGKQAGPGTAEQTPRQAAAMLPGISAKCLGELRDGFGWAADLPKATPIYPGGHVEAAAGVRGVCSLRTLRYVTAAEPGDVLDFHFTLLARAGYQVEREGDTLVARKGRAAARIGVARAGGMTAVALASSS
jgi:hypothetical protein